MKHKKIQVGIIGSGRVGVDWHLPDIREAGGEVLALADVVPGRATRYAALLDVPHAFNDVQSLLRLPDVDAVTICTPPVTHREIAIAALQAGKHVYLEKPPAMNAAEMRDIRDQARAVGKRLYVGSNAIAYHEVQALRNLIREGQLGRIYYVEALKIIRRSYKKGWHRRKAVAGGGVGMDSCPHRIDLALFLLGNPEVLSVSARSYHFFVNRPEPENTPEGYQLMDVAEKVDLQHSGEPADVEDTVTAFIQLAGGCTMVLRDMAGANMPDEWSFKVFGTKAGATLPELMLYGETEDGTVTDTVYHTLPNPQGVHVLAFKHFFDCIKEGRETWSNGDRAVNVMRVIDAIYDSAAQHGSEIRFIGER